MVEEGVTPQSGQRVLRRSRSDRVIAGVAGGLGRYLGVDPVLLRIAFALLVIAGGSGILLYLIGWIVIPEEREGEEVEGPTDPSGNGRVILGIVVVIIGLFLLMQTLFPGMSRYFWPLAIVVAGFAIIVGGRR